MSDGIVLRGLTCVYPGSTRPALADLDLDVPRGALVVVMGASGAGKTTIARCVTRIAPCFTPAAVTGRVRLGDLDIGDRRPGELAGTIGMVFQDFEAQIFSTDVIQEVVFGLEHTGVAPEEMPARAAAALAAVGLSGFEGRDPTTLSGGEKQRLAIAGLVALRPGIMVFDEPTTDLDPVGRLEVIDVLERLRGEGVAVLLIDHDPASAVEADHLVVLREGRVFAEGAPAAVFADAARCDAAGVRPPDTARVFERLGLDHPPLDPIVAAERLRTTGWCARPTPLAPPPPREPLVVIERLTHRYPDGRVAVSEIDCTIGAGAWVALVGKNGSGKTTLAKHVNGLLRPTAGQVRIAGHVVASLSLEAVAQQVGYVFQDPDHQLFAATAWDEVAFGPRNVGLTASAVDERVTEALTAVGLDAVRDIDPFVLDKGARQRLAVASVLALRPRILVLDEPTTGLDWHEQRSMMALLARLHAAGTTLLVITHTPWVVAEYAERVLMLAGGRLAFDGPVREFLADEACVRAASFTLPDVTRLGRALGCTPRSVDEMLGWLVREGTA